MLENIRANQQFQDARAVRLGGFRFHALLHPLPPLGIGNVHELRTNRAAINVRAASASAPETSSSGIATDSRSPSGSRSACKYPQRRNASQVWLCASLADDESTMADCLFMNLLEGQCLLYGAACGSANADVIPLSQLLGLDTAVEWRTCTRIQFPCA